MRCWDRGKLKAGQTLLVLGAAGGVRHCRGRDRQSASVLAWSLQLLQGEKAAAAGNAGADEAVVYPDWNDIDRKGARSDLQGRGRSRGVRTRSTIPWVVITVKAALRSIAWEGRFLVVGFPAGIAKASAQPHATQELRRLRRILGCGSRHGIRRANAAHVDQLFRWWAEGKIAPEDRRGLRARGAGEAIAALRDRKAIGKLVVTID